MGKITEVTKILLIINVIMFFGTELILSNPTQIFGVTVHKILLALFHPATDLFQPFQVVTHMFMHGSPSHLIFNMVTLYFFGPPLEQRLGFKKFFNFYFICGFGAMLLHLLATYIEVFSFGIGNIGIPMLGASGAIAGVVMGFVVFYPNQMIYLLIPPMPLKAKYLGIGYIGISFVLGITGSIPGIAHFAHLGGALVGLALVWYWKRQGV